MLRRRCNCEGRGSKHPRSCCHPRVVVGNEKKYQHTIEPLTAEKDGTTIVTARLTGNFPGSPVDLELIFTVDAGKIRSLEIK